VHRHDVSGHEQGAVSFKLKPNSARSVPGSASAAGRSRRWAADARPHAELQTGKLARDRRRAPRLRPRIGRRGGAIRVSQANRARRRVVAHTTRPTRSSTRASARINSRLQQTRKICSSIHRSIKPKLGGSEAGRARRARWRQHIARSVTRSLKSARPPAAKSSASATRPTARGREGMSMRTVRAASPRCSLPPVAEVTQPAGDPLPASERRQAVGRGERRCLTEYECGERLVRRPPRLSL
jgi:hypothetical protein